MLLGGSHQGAFAPGNQEAGTSGSSPRSSSSAPTGPLSELLLSLSLLSLADPQGCQYRVLTGERSNSMSIQQVRYVRQMGKR